MPTHTRYMRLMNMTGDTTVAWTEDNDDRMRAQIQAMLDEGYTFFIVEKPWYGLGLVEKQNPLLHVDDLKGRQVLAKDLTSRELAGLMDRPGRRTQAPPAVTTGDAGMDRAFQQGLVRVAKTPSPEQTQETTRRADTAEEVVTHNTVAFRPIAGG